MFSGMYAVELMLAATIATSVPDLTGSKALSELAGDRCVRQGAWGTRVRVLRRTGSTEELEAVVAKVELVAAPAATG